MSVSAYQKNYLEDKKPFFKHFYPKDVAVLAIRTGAMQGLLVFNAYVASLDLDEDDSEDDEFGDVDDKKPEFTPPSADEFTRACTKSFTKSLSITTYTRSLEEVALIYFRPQIVSKLIKGSSSVIHFDASQVANSVNSWTDISKSAMRKYFRTSSRFASAALMLKTGMRASILGHFAIFLVEEVGLFSLDIASLNANIMLMLFVVPRQQTQQLILILYRRFVNKGGKKPGKLLRDGETVESAASTPDESFASITMRNASRSGLAIVTSGVGAAIGTVIRPGLGTMIGGTLGDSIAYVL